MPACTPAGHIEAQIFARPFGAEWAENLDHTLPDQLNAALTTRPTAVLNLAALGAFSLVGTVTHMSDIISVALDNLHRHRRTVLIADMTQPDG